LWRTQRVRLHYDASIRRPPHLQRRANTHDGNRHRVYLLAPRLLATAARNTRADIRYPWRSLAVYLDPGRSSSTASTPCSLTRNCRCSRRRRSRSSTLLDRSLLVPEHVNPPLLAPPSPDALCVGCTGDLSEPEWSEISCRRIAAWAGAMPRRMNGGNNDRCVLACG